MSTLGQLYVADCLSYAGRVVEATGQNDGPQVRRWQREAEIVYGQPAGFYIGAPWCAIGAGCVARESGILLASTREEYRLWHPYTGYIADQADRMGGLAPAGPIAPPGALLVKPGVHVAVNVYDRGNGLMDTVEFNAGNAVRRLVREKADWRIIVPPGLEANSRPEWVDSYGFDDLSVKPVLMGGWPTTAGREKAKKLILDDRPGWWTRDVKTHRDSPFSFWLGAPGTWGGDWSWWEYGGWTAGGDSEQARQTREDQIKAFSRRYGHENVRRWRRRVPVPKKGIIDRSGVFVTAGDISTQ